MRFLRLSVVNIAPMPAGMTADASALFGLFRLLNNVNALVAEGISTVAGTTTTTLVLTAAQVLTKNIVMTTGNITGAFTINLPSTSSIIDALGGPDMIPLDGSASFPLWISNQGTGQTGTLTAGDANTTVSATENSLATNVSGKWIVNVGLSGTTPTLTLTRVLAGDA